MWIGSSFVKVLREIRGFNTVRKANNKTYAEHCHKVTEWSNVRFNKFSKNYHKILSRIRTSLKFIAWFFYTAQQEPVKFLWIREQAKKGITSRWKFLFVLFSSPFIFPQFPGLREYATSCADIFFNIIKKIFTSKIFFFGCFLFFCVFHRDDNETKGRQNRGRKKRNYQKSSNAKAVFN